MEVLLEPLQYAFMQRSLAVALLIGILGAMAGSYLMVQRLALLGDAISHSVLAGLAAAFAMGLPLAFGAFVAGLLSAASIDLIRTRSPLKADAAMGIVLSAFFALGVTLITLIQKQNKIDLNHFLFGNLLAVSPADLRDTAIVAGLVAIAIVLFHKELQFYCFDRLAAQAAGLPVRWFDLGLTVILAMTIVVAMKAVGVLLVIAMLITPPATAYLWVRRFVPMMLLAIAIGSGSSLVGLYLSFFWDLPSGPAIVLVASVVFVVTLLINPRRNSRKQR
ncbi:metal ABC transporter permease [Synechococcus elongatus]|uniref:Manganese transport system membrane protein MntB n=2 Tax=Synechococcus elongatus TaxID=32046 RepID=Q31K16_SYNE7|nr:metal ABC transporter permease [Synechococcus elongatus]ABB58603.1 manganese transport system membrane protein MntB [Synechococcus elongatus PCC 7942 = FACHB-805]AJD56944.1 membrane protein [Synechococcus elongatus UTEX 2973]MBD2587323.1 metal ABC transporter permease [Synechococcus elongatus FACHB-242]MBD2688392.1 metal ABC transporter permease [Synechococcus elongatus FACHB-1061]MBD2705896.1 metal ABC transporter permease [Synechococcus elongatus PCC 7942 = FACHB-805]